MRPLVLVGLLSTSLAPVCGGVPLPVLVELEARVTRVGLDFPSGVSVGDALAIRWVFDPGRPDLCPDPAESCFGGGLLSLTLSFPDSGQVLSWGGGDLSVYDDRPSSGLVGDEVALDPDALVFGSLGGEVPDGIRLTFRQERPASGPPPELVDSDAAPVAAFAYPQGIVDLSFASAAATGIEFVPSDAPVTACPPAPVAEVIPTHPFPGLAAGTGEPGGVARVGNAFWIADDEGPALFAWDPAGPAVDVVSTDPYPGSGVAASDPEGVAYDGARLWVASSQALDALDPAACLAGTAGCWLERIDLSPVVASQVTGLAWDGSSLWAVGEDFPDSASCLHRIDVDAGVVAGTRCYDGRGLLPERGDGETAFQGLAWDGRRLWIGDGAKDAAFAVEPETGGVTGCLDLHAAGVTTLPLGLGLDVDGTDLWAVATTTFGDERLARIELAQVDQDGDGVNDLSDLCPLVPDPPDEGSGAQADADGDGVGDACECGDASADGFVTARDARRIQRCAAGAIACPSLCDVDGDGECGAADARRVQRFAVGALDGDALLCAERGTGGWCDSWEGHWCPSEAVRKEESYSARRWRHARRPTAAKVSTVSGTTNSIITAANSGSASCPVESSTR